VCTSDTQEQGFFIVKVFALQEVSVALPGIVDEMPVYFVMLSSYTINDVGEKRVIINTLGNEKMLVTIMLADLKSSTKLTPCVRVNRKNSVSFAAVCGVSD
jgi:hypothetical protein